jgi:hypothetical protein
VSLVNAAADTNKPAAAGDTSSWSVSIHLDL